MVMKVFQEDIKSDYQNQSLKDIKDFLLICCQNNQRYLALEHIMEYRAQAGPLCHKIEDAVRTFNILIKGKVSTNDFLLVRFNHIPNEKEFNNNLQNEKFISNDAFIYG